MKLILLFILTIYFFSGTALSATRLKFLPMDRNVVITVSAADIYGNADSDSADLYELMLVPEQDSMLGKGKSIVSPARDFNFICSKEKKMCQVVLNKSENAVISSSGKFARFTLRGSPASTLTKLFKNDQNGEFHFTATDRLFKISGRSELFIFETAEAAF